MKTRQFAAWGAVLCAPAAASAQFTLDTYALPEGNTILQVTGAVVSNTPGGPSTDETRTAYVFAPDFNDPAPNFPDFTGGTWPYVYLPSDATLDDVYVGAGITADLALLPNPNSPAGLQWLLVNGNPLYQFINDNDPLDANGNFGPWNYLATDGTPTQSLIPAPGAAALLGMGAVAGTRRRRST